MANNLQGQQYGTWRVTARHGTNGNRYATWLCTCVRCGSEAVISSKRLSGGTQRICRNHTDITNKYKHIILMLYSVAMIIMHKSLTIISFIPWLIWYAIIGAAEGIIQGLEDWSEWYNESRWM
ncbi:MAG: hypothetical protein GY941_10785 [Planctomycetes bacterium]|nr:hypothetical protein [Planctomycetota bacterium]